MPFGLKLRRTRRYNVLSKNCFVTRIRLLDSNVIECTLSVESTGQECLEAVAQRLELRETHYFGLWFLSKSQQARWVELEKPLKKHLDKFANEPLLFFGVMFYVPNVSWLQQEATRYQYYLQVKKDVLEGRLRCTLEQVIRLAGLAVQADFGDYNQFDSQDFLREYVLFPMDLALEEAVLEELTQKVAQEHKAHSGILPAEAELLYINEVERLDGFGQEIFPVKDNHGNSVHLGIFFMGIFVRNRIGRQAVIHRWNDMGNITHNKSTILVELTNKEETVLFHTDDIENAKYISRLFATRHKFYKQNKICTEQSNSPPPIRRQPTWSRSSLPRQQPYILPPMHVQCGEHYSETHTSQDSIFHGNEDAFYCNSHNSLDLNYLNGTITNGSVCSVHSINSLNCSQSFIQASPVSSNLSIPGSDIMRADYIPSHRHSAIIVPSYRPTPDYDTVMRQMKRGVVHTDSQSQSLRNLNILNTHAYNQPEDLVYSQPEMRERHPYTVPYGPQGGYGNKLVGPSDQMSPKNNSVPSQPGASAISHTVSTPELANMQLQGAHSYNAAHMLKNHLFRPPPPYPRPRPATSTPDLASHRHKYVSGSSPDLVTRKVQLSVKTFQEDSAPVVHQSLQEVSEPLTATKHHGAAHKRHSLEVMSSMVRGMEAMTLKSLNIPMARRNTLREPGPPKEVPGGHEVPQLPQYHHKKTFSDATMLIHSSESEEEEEPAEPAPRIPGLRENMGYSAQLQAALARIPKKPPPEYPGPRKSVSNGALRQDQVSVPPAVARARVLRHGPAKAVSVSRADQLAVNGPSLGPSISEPDLTSVKERVKKEPVKERPVSEMFSLEDSIIEREMMIRNLEKQKMAGLEAQKRPLMLAALNGLSVARVSGREDGRVDGTRILMDERFRTLKKKLEEGMVFTEYEQIPKKKANGIFSTAALPENAERSRIREVVPYEENRVELIPTKENNTGYINASHIKVVVGGAEWHYIATQGPLPHTCHDFWQMVWEQGANVIAMVTAEEEGGRTKSHRYWPKLGSKHSSATYGKFKVTTKFRTDSGCYATTGLKVKHLLSGQERTVWHLQYTDWPDHGCPEDVQGFLSYLEEIQSVRRHTNSMLEGTQSRHPPIVVHCTAGVGRTGVVILSELMIYCLEHNEKVEVPMMLRLLREQRMFMIQTIAQYKFVYQVLIQFLQNSRLI
ncbi:tyrosine-protein phosphatase non-receptor type 14 isoform X1 [Eptesicus fuscus]|uniref:tyrosine-protein phosphatase non-receptor type 14 isoform X1 n=1 Tax=Eptesicus fuscus TaxID=29078 RepID=UPI002403BF21|nr:tyrosine-protein phosphatase non-receptor type 14 isoform X1 [Eptesicus fuscus]XP_028008000.2 tyrosine-protein phosphatase non-receptor type 14 isoform X1 [Eptesicus fuscus]XP_028008002.2 tyrosine-protein phosphatase non-receptor type 14 isoform X1 [Eptesicus fuscus]XP_028008003.2 tyrosine-protein phosphatase non-receptor type 14 isoform X1 [Eptesicus fuscus]XP_054567472.1 tyrosine-protein phosphatase non-receptor type 14 isoform X1 [Eptesicus fuscus]